MKYAKLPNGNIVPVDDLGFIKVRVGVDLSDFIQHNLEGVLDLLSEKSTGSTLLSNINYRVLGVVCGNTLEIEVTGELDAMEPEILDSSEVTESEFDIQVIRVSYGTRNLRVSARTATEAEAIADDDAGDHLYSENHSEYIVRANTY